MTERKPSPTEARILEIQSRLRSWNSFVRDLKVPSDLAPAFLTSRVELLRLARPRPLTESECAVMYDLVGGLLETNLALREHAIQVAELAATMDQGLRGALHATDRMRAFANFSEPAEPEDEGGSQ